MLTSMTLKLTTFIFIAPCSPSYFGMVIKVYICLYVHLNQEDVIEDRMNAGLLSQEFNMYMVFGIKNMYSFIVIKELSFKLHLF